MSGNSKPGVLQWGGATCCFRAPTHTTGFLPAGRRKRATPVWVSVTCVAVCCSVLRCVVVCCSVSQCVAVCCSVLLCVAVCCSMLRIRLVPFRQVIKKEQLLCIRQWPGLQYVAVCCIFFAVCCNVSACCSVLHMRLVTCPQVVDKGRLLCMYR